MTVPSVSIELARSWLQRSAENIGDPHAGRLLAELADHLGPRLSGPSKARQRAIERRDRGLRQHFRERYSGKSARAAAEEIAARAARYAGSRLRHDIAEGRSPVSGIELIVFEAVRDGARVPGPEQLRAILGGKLGG